ncbi:MAG: hypothetical protein OXG35_32155 [Acidobacteria bacterium]|nr:hypothetical protein [Acidobacteriota bacterium]
MVVVPAWTFGAALIVIGTLIFMICITDDDQPPENCSRAQEFTQTGGLGMFGLAFMAAGIWVTWIGPDPEPLSAWIAIAITLSTSIMGIATSTLKSGIATTTAITASIMVGLTLIIRASIHQFN